MRAPDRRHLVRAAAVLAALGLLTGAGDPDEARDKLDDINRRIEQSKEKAQVLTDQAGAASTALAALQADLVRLAAEAQARESEIAALGPDIARLEAERDDAKSQLAARMDGLMRSLGALERLERRPPAALLARPGDAIDRARSATLLGAIVPRLSADAQELKRRLAAIDVIETDLLARRAAIEAARADLAKARRDLDRTLARRALERDRLNRALEGERQRLDALGRKARDLAGLIAALEAEARNRDKAAAEDDAPDPPKISAEALAAVADRLPARGRIVQAFGGGDGAGGRADGLTIQAAPGAQVTTPTPGRVAFAGPFKGYGQLLIVAAPGGYHVLLAGLTRIYADPGQDLKSGEPVGELGEGKDGARLYVEVRRRGKPIDPMPYLAARDGKVSG